MVQRADLIIAIACVPCGPRGYLCVRVRILSMLKIVCCCTIKPDCHLRRLLWSPFLTDSAALSCPTTPLHYTNNVEAFFLFPRHCSIWPRHCSFWPRHCSLLLFVTGLQLLATTLKLFATKLQLFARKRKLFAFCHDIASFCLLP